MTEFGPSLKTFNGKYLERRSSFYTKNTIFNNPCEFHPTDLATSIQTNNTNSSTYLNKNTNNITFVH